MYSPDSIRQLQLQTQDLLKNIQQENAFDISLLKQVLQFHEYRYYVLNDPLIADQ